MIDQDKIKQTHMEGLACARELLESWGYDVRIEGNAGQERLTVDSVATLRVKSAHLGTQGGAKDGYRFRGRGDADYVVLCCLGDVTTFYVVPGVLMEKYRAFTIPGPDPDWGPRREQDYRNVWLSIFGITTLAKMGVFMDRVLDAKSTL